MDVYLHTYVRSYRCGVFSVSDSINHVLLTGPGVGIKHVLLVLSEISALDERFGLLLQMLAVVGDTGFIELLLDRRVDPNVNCAEERNIITSILSRGYYFHTGGETREILSFCSEAV